MAPPVLKVVEPDKPYILQTNASELGLGAVLSQVKNGKEHPVALLVESFCKQKELLSNRNGMFSHCVVTSSVLCI